jgi:uncharacterized protein
MDELIAKTSEYVRQKMLKESTGHDWWHVERVWKMTKRLLASYPQADRQVVELAALLHDLGDYKIVGSSANEEEILVDAMSNLGFDEGLTQKVLAAIATVSFSKNVGKSQNLTIEQKIVQDADRLDAIGAIGITRAFAYGGKTGRSIYDPTQKVKKYSTVEERRASMNSTIHHFEEKLLLIKDLLNTPEAKMIGEGRQKYMQEFLAEFHNEWNAGS